MKKQTLMALAAKPELISGIYNYCDQWCERCPMTSRCLTFLTMQAEDADDPPLLEDDPESVLRYLGENLQTAMEMLTDLAEESGVDLSFEDEEAKTWRQERDRLTEEIRQSPLSKMAYQYIESGTAWVNTCNDLMKSKDVEINTSLRIGLPQEATLKSLEEIKDALETVTFYIHLIYIKLLRAQESSHDSSIGDDDENFINDADATAKLVLVCLDRSIDAWQTLLSHFPDEEESLFPLLSLLQRLRTMTEMEFPKARSCKRPGLDA